MGLLILRMADLYHVNLSKLELCSPAASPTQSWVSMDHTGILCELGKKAVKQHLKGGCRVPGAVAALVCH